MTETEMRIRDVLTRTGLYCGEDPLFSAECAAYGVGLEMLVERISECGRNLFVQTADEATIEGFERIFRILPSGGKLEQRREMLLERGSVMSTDSTLNALSRQLTAAGIIGNIVEGYQGGLYVNVLGLMGISEAVARLEADSFMPAHLPYTLDFGRNTWDSIDGRKMSFNAMDNAADTWEQLDLI